MQPEQSSKQLLRANVPRRSPAKAHGFQIYSPDSDPLPALQEQGISFSFSNSSSTTACIRQFRSQSCSEALAGRKYGAATLEVAPRCVQLKELARLLHKNTG